MDVGDPDLDVVETSDVEEFEELEGSTHGLLKKSMDYLRGNTDQSEIRFPPRKRMKLLHDSAVSNAADVPFLLTSPICSPLPSTTSPRGSQSSATMLGGISPGRFLDSPHSPTEAPFRAPDNLLTKVANYVLTSSSSLALGNSQRPFIRSPTQGGISTCPSPADMELTTIETRVEENGPPWPHYSQPTTQTPLTPKSRRSDSPDPLSTFAIASFRTPRSSLNTLAPPPFASSQPPSRAEESADELLLFSPAKRLSPTIESSPITPLSSNPGSLRSNLGGPSSSQQVSPSPPHEYPPSPLPVPLVPPLYHPPPEVVRAAHEEENAGRYTLRGRKPIQVRPFTGENAQYQAAMRSIPEAIVKQRNLDRRGRRLNPEDHYENDEKEEDGYAFENDEEEWEERQRRRHREREELSKATGDSTRSPERPSEPERPLYPSILQDIQSTDEEDGIVGGLTKEDRKFLRARKKQKRIEKEKEKEALRQQDEILSRPKKSPRHRISYFPIPAQAQPSTTSRTPLKSGEENDPGIDDPPLYPIEFGEDQPCLSPSASPGAKVFHDYSHEVNDFEGFLQDDFPAGRDDDISPANEPDFVPHLFTDSPANDVIDIGSDNEERQISPSLSPQSIPSVALEKGQEKLLGRMYPKFMIPGIITKGFRKTNKEKRRKSVSGDEADGPLLPGRTRVQRIANPKDLKEIKGDSESEAETDPDEDSDPPSPFRPAVSRHGTSDKSESDSDAVEIVEMYRPKGIPKKPRAVFDVDDGVFSESENIIYDEHIDEHFTSNRTAGKRGAVNRLKEPSLIDWMLARSRTIGGTRKDHQPKSSKSRKKSSKSKLDIMTNGARRYGHERQTLLSFEGARKAKKRKRGSRSGSRTIPAVPSHHNQFSDQEGHVADIVEVDQHYRRQRRWKEKEKARRARGKTQGIWTFTYEGQGVSSGRQRDTAFVTIDLEDEGFHRALAPISDNPVTGWTRKFQQPKPQLQIALPNSIEETDSVSDEVVCKAKERQPTDVASDLNINPFHSGKCFGPQTYIGKGWLQDLLDVASGTHIPTIPPSINAIGFKLEPDMGVQALREMLPNIFDCYFDFATGLPDLEGEGLRPTWILVAHVAAQLVSHYLTQLDEPDSMSFRKFTEEQLLRLVDKIEKLSLKFIEPPILGVSQSASVTSSASKSFKSGVNLLTALLLQFGLRKTIESLQNDADLNKPSTSLYAAELWVCLIHVLSLGFSEGQTGSKKHPFWLTLKEALQNQEFSTPFARSEDVWFAIFAVCAFSQFSSRGMTTSNSRLPAYWDLVADSMKLLTLRVLPNDAERFTQKERWKRDLYAAIVTIRCYHLVDRWQWKLKDGLPMFQELAEIFKTRQCANLLPETAQNDFPEFFRLANWDLLDSHDPKDNAYTVFLKLVVRGAREDESYRSDKPSGRLKKLLSLAVPISTITAPSHNLTMFYNRLCAVAIVADLNPNDCVSWTRRAQGYINYLDSDHTTRLALIRGVARFAIMLVSRRRNIKATVDWIEEISKGMEMELKKFPPPHRKDPQAPEAPETPERRNAELFAKLLLASIRQIMEFYVKVSRYPDPLFLASLKPVLTTWVLKTDGIKDEFARLATAIFDARSAALPPPSRPPLPVTAPPVEDESQESQEFGGIDLDLDGMNWDAVDIPALATPIASQPSNDAANENAMREALTSTRFKWLIPHFLNPCLQPPLAGASVRAAKAHESDCDLWLRLWLSCASVEVDPEKWSNALRLLDARLEGTTDERWVRRVNLSIMYQVLQIEPMAYLTQANRAIEVVLSALISDSVALAKEYVAFVLSIDGLQHPLLRGATCLPARNEVSGDYEFSSDHFLELRLSLLQVIFKNLNDSYRIERDGNLDLVLDNERYVGYCIKMFSGMRSNRSSLESNSVKFSAYNDFCIQVLQHFQDNRDLCMEKRFDFWIRWARDLRSASALALNN
ncbi:hypothetical protein M413DRAFT_442856 [Hebeloma cylindrosporum]|uniref:Protein mms22 n=1 Tax=Hebeloma cylindrosporum TaxID=76867 RepID=A0A0C2Y4T8_HEBCY|nr:hypothetical protein M413DRAFT_442856 [Hebeloma cylindrosporum h7]